MVTPTALLVLALAAFLVGLAKTSLGGLATVSVTLFALVLPTRESTAALLLVFLVGDAIAVSMYRHEADWSLIRSLLPGIVPGLVLGTAVLAVVSDDVLLRGLGVVVLILVVLQILVHRRSSAAPRPWPGPARASVGVAAGFTTMVANAAGPVMALYLVGQGVEKRRFVGTAAWFFLGVNLAKLPFSIGLGLVSPDMLVTTLLLAPAVALGACAGVLLLDRMRQRVFDVAVLTASALSAVPLLLGG